MDRCWRLAKYHINYNCLQEFQPLAERVEIMLSWWRISNHNSEVREGDAWDDIGLKVYDGDAWDVGLKVFDAKDVDNPLYIFIDCKSAEEPMQDKDKK